MVGNRERADIMSETKEFILYENGILFKVKSNHKRVNKAEFLAQMFCGSDAMTQAEFFHFVHEISERWENEPDSQWSYLSDYLTKDGQEIIKKINAHANSESY
jgi:hypothetical protein